MITNYFDVYRKKVDLSNLDKLIQDKEEKMKEYDNFLTSSAGSSLLINRLMSRNFILTEKSKAQDEEEKKKIQQDYAIEFLAFDDMQANISKSFTNIMKEELLKYLKVYYKSENGLDLNKNLDYLTVSAIKEDDKTFAYKFSKFINAMFYSLDKGGYTQPIKLSNYIQASGVKDLYNQIMNNLYRESLNVVAVDYMKGDSGKTVSPTNSNINSVPAGF